MPGFDGRGPSGQGPMTGRGRGFCILRVSEGKPGEVKGLAGVQGVPVRQQQVESLESTGKEVSHMPFGDGTGPVGLGPMTGRAAGFCAGFPMPGYMTPVMGRAGFYGSGMTAAKPYGPVLYGYGLPYGVRVTPWFRRAFGLGRGFGRGRGRGRGGFGCWW
jgi:hypothetical protein